jgi:hypothetical protein
MYKPPDKEFKMIVLRNFSRLGGNTGKQFHENKLSKCLILYYGNYMSVKKRETWEEIGVCVCGNQRKREEEPEWENTLQPTQPRELR